MGLCLSLCTGNLPTWTSTYSGTVTTPSQLSVVLSTSFPPGPQQFVAILSFSTKRRPTSERHQHNANTPNGLWTRWSEGLIGLLGRHPKGLTTRALQVPSLLSMKLKPRVTFSYPTHKVFVKVSRRYVGSMAYRPTSKVVILSGTYWSPSRTKTLWSTKVGPFIGSNVVTSLVMMSI